MLHLLCKTVNNRENGSEEHLVRYGFKVEPKPSIFGINGGRITMAIIKVDGKVVCHYNKLGGLIVQPDTSDPITGLAISYLLSNYN